MRRRLNVLRAVVCGAICLLALASLPLAVVMAQSCDDCREIKGLPAATPRPTRAAIPAPTAVELTVAPSPAAPVVRMVLYWAEGCGHCHEVLDGILPQVQQKYGSQLKVRLVEVVTLEDITAFYHVAEGFGFARGRAAVPFLLIGDHALMGVEQIEAGLPGLITAALAASGTDWPAPPAQDGFGKAVATTDDTCGFTVPCPEETAAGAGAAAAQAGPPITQALFVLAAASAFGLALTIGAVTVWRRSHSAARPRD